jgi:hypothetical protein
MDLDQQKLSKLEWNNIEVPVSESEQRILEIIMDGYLDVNLRKNDTMSLLAYMKIEHTPAIEQELYKKYFEPKVDGLKTKYMKSEVNKPSTDKKQKKMIPLKSKDLIRIKSMDGKIDQQRSRIFEFTLVEFCEEILKSIYTKTPKYAFYLYTLIQLKKATVPLLNCFTVEFVDSVIHYTKDRLNIMDVMSQAYSFIEKNPYLLKYEDKSLFDHQKQLFTIFKKRTSPANLVLYIAPTGTGKTLSPIGLSQEHRIIFVCAARHVGLALAKSAVSVGKRVAFAFGCETASDIRLHYFSASDYTRNKRSGGIGKVNNSVGDKVQIMICDVKSYLTAMHYMIAFTPMSEEEVTRPGWDLIMYWDEPTITMDYDSHDLHETMHRNWVENKISNVVFSCATLPKDKEIADTIQDFKIKFPDSEIHSITSYECKKSISVLNKGGYSVLPHFLFSDYSLLQKSVCHCIENKTLLRYFDLNEIVRFIECVHSKAAIPDRFFAEIYFGDDISRITMNSLKVYYLELLQNVDEMKWPEIYRELLEKRSPKFTKKIRKIRSMDLGSMRSSGQLTRTMSMAIVPSVSQPVIPVENSTGILLATEDAHTLTDGPTLFLCEDLEKVSKFYIESANIPDRVYKSVSETIAKNSVLSGKIETLVKNLEDKAGKELEKENKMEKDHMSSEMRRLSDQIMLLRSEINFTSLDPAYIPNSLQHQRIWTTSDEHIPNAFMQTVDESSIKEIMALNVSDQKKLLLLLGIGVFSKDAKCHTADSTSNPDQLAYMEVMKHLAYKQQLYLILAASDYVYGTNYQFCHGFIGKDLTNMTQQKTIQAMGRVGRNQIQQEYTIRFRDDEMLTQLFMPAESNKEAETMSRLFNTDT